MGFLISNYFNNPNKLFYAGFGAIQTNNSIKVVFNDRPRNAGVTSAGQKLKMTRRFDNSECFILSLDVVAGKYERNEFFTNRDIPTAIPRLGSVIGNEMYITVKSDRVFGKTKIAVAKITMR